MHRMLRLPCQTNTHPDAQNAAPATTSAMASPHPDAQNAAPATTEATASPKCCACHDFARPPPRARQHPVPLDSCRMLPLPHKHTHPDAQNAAPATTSATASPKCCACHDFAHPPPRARQHPVPLDSCRMLPLPHKHTPRCTECSACHDFGNGIAKVLRLPRFRTPPAARAPTSCPSRQLPNATPATQTHTQMHRMQRLPRLRQWHRQSAAPATISHTPRCARANILSL